MGNYTNALRYIKERKNEKHEMLYEWEISKKQWAHCMESKFKEEILAIIIRFLVGFGLFMIIVLLSYIFDSPKYAKETASLIPYVFFVTLAASFFPFFVKIIYWFYPGQYKFFMDNHGIFNGIFYAHLRFFPKDTVISIEAWQQYVGKNYNYVSCLKYKLFENENKFEIEILSSWVGSYSSGSKNEWFCLMFNDKDKKIIYKIIKDWQEDGKIEPYAYSDRLILEKYLDNIK
jgi:ABC-type multidrug transport system fused ATPase/permease subunit